MRYLYAIAAFVVLITVFFLSYPHFSGKAVDKEIVLRVNDRLITRAEFNRRQRLSTEVRDSFAPEGQEDFIQSLVTKELLIQESKRLGIDREEPFRQSVQNFYEQSLIKILMERQYASLAIEASEAEIARYVQFTNGILRMAVITYPDKKAVAANRPAGETTVDRFFHDLANDLKATLLSVSVGTATSPLLVGEHYEAYRVIGVEEDPALTEKTPLAATQIKERITQYKQEKAMTDWLHNLRDKAIVENHLNAGATP